MDKKLEQKIFEEEIRKRFKKARKALHLTQSEMGRRLNEKTESIKDMEIGKKKITPIIAKKVEKYLGVSASWLIFGEGNMFLEKDKATQILDSKIKVISSTTNEIILSYERDIELALQSLNLSFIPLVEPLLDENNNFKISQENVTGFYAFKNEWLVQKDIEPKKAVLVRMIGDSMSSLIDDGDFILIDLNDKNINEGKVYAIAYKKTIFVKRAAFGFNKIILKSENQKYSDIEVENGEIDKLNIIGRVKWIAKVI